MTFYNKITSLGVIKQNKGRKLLFFIFYVNMTSTSVFIYA